MANEANHLESVLVTGASTGIGYATAGLLARSGFVVYAGVRSARDAGSLQALHANVRPSILDVRCQEDIARLASEIERSGGLLRGLVNNAGIAVAGPLEYVPLDELREQFEVNVFGALAVTQSMLPLLRRSRGRIAFISSVSGQIAPPFIGPYAASKFALEAMSDSLRMELGAFGISVSVIQPGNVRTPIWKKGRDRKDDLIARLPQHAYEQYASAVEALVHLTHREERTGVEPGVVAQAVLRALTDPRPRARYAVGNPPAWQRRFAALLPERWRDRLILRNFNRPGSG